MTYNLTNVTNADNIAEIFIGMNQASGNILTNMVLIVLGVIFMIVLLRNNPPAEAITATGGVLSIISLSFLAIGLTDIVFVIGSGLLFAGGGVALYLSNR